LLVISTDGQWQFKVGCQNPQLREQQNFQNCDHVKCYTQFQELASTVYLDPELVLFGGCGMGKQAARVTDVGVSNAVRDLSLYNFFGVQ
jgi:hypothetical protein